MVELHTTNHAVVSGQFPIKVSGHHILCDIGNCQNSFDTKIWDCNLRESRPICNECLESLEDLS